MKTVTDAAVISVTDVSDKLARGFKTEVRWEPLNRRLEHRIPCSPDALLQGAHQREGWKAPWVESAGIA